MTGRFIIVLTLLFTLIIIMLIKANREIVPEIMPDIYYFGDRNGQLITILAGTHGDEPAPSIFLKEFLLKNKI